MSATVLSATRSSSSDSIGSSSSGAVAGAAHDLLPDKPVAFAKPLDTLVIDCVADPNVSLATACRLLNADELVAFPTETVYGIGANALSERACSKIFIAKGRPSDNPLIVHISSEAMLARVADVDATQLASGGIVRQLIDRFWPGPLTILLPKASNVPQNVTAGQPKVGVRMPANSVARRLIAESNCPLAAPSANLSGKPSPTLASHVLDDLRGRVACVIDGGECQHGVESTVLDALATPPLILRPGSITLDALRTILPTVELFERSKHGAAHIEAPATPGLKYRHYAPVALMTLLLPRGAVRRVDDAALVACVKRALKQDGVIGVAYLDDERSSRRNVLKELSSQYDGRIQLFDMGQSALDAAHNFYNALRSLDALNCSEIVVEGVADDDDGQAVLNRMRKAAATIELVD